GARTARAGTREHDQVRSRRHADELRLLLGRRRRRCALARRRTRPARPACLYDRRCAGVDAAAPTARAGASTGRGGSMTCIRTFAAFWWSFLVGDDWRLTTGLLLAIGATLILHRGGLPAWWLVRAAVALLLRKSLQRATR